MQQLDEPSSEFLAISCEQEEQVVELAQQLAKLAGGTLSDESLGADVWFACLQLPEGLVQLHYDWLVGGFWLQPTGLLAADVTAWHSLLDKLKPLAACSKR
ncbi:hypothetical protein IC617_00905 [Neiella sp. HB171785]|uniref:DUF3630 family protein n=1 Tax=Neiella litorisoli TaxID=2771431 RepID=A0A8J6UPC0_9GAMM|nr:hypothetical protein [Neiella litorisoli]MBD1387977.1 hypothetical protein [Neiella litorisoli]